MEFFAGEVIISFSNGYPLITELLCSKIVRTIIFMKNNQLEDPEEQNSDSDEEEEDLE